MHVRWQCEKWIKYCFVKLQRANSKQQTWGYILEYTAQCIGKPKASELLLEIRTQFVWWFNLQHIFIHLRFTWKDENNKRPQESELEQRRSIVCNISCIPFTVHIQSVKWISHEEKRKKNSRKNNVALDNYWKLSENNFRNQFMQFSFCVLCSVWRLWSEREYDFPHR